MIASSSSEIRRQAERKDCFRDHSSWRKNLGLLFGLLLLTVPQKWAKRNWFWRSVASSWLPIEMSMGFLFVFLWLCSSIILWGASHYYMQLGRL
ncbi:hypothetical protein BJX64DRAFT_249602 [Aspergillus heterothallicus]